MRFVFLLGMLACVACQGGKISPTWIHDGFGSALAFADFNCDDMTDLAVGAPGADRIDIFTGNASGLAGNPVSIYATARKTGFGDNLVALPDVNGDGCDDLLVLTSQRAAVYGGQASGIQSTPLWTDSDRQWVAGAGGDVDGDGLADVLLGGEGEVRLYLGAASGVTAVHFWQALQDPSDGEAFGVRVALADFDDDGTLDPIVADPLFDVPGENGSDHGRIFGYPNDNQPDTPAVDPDTVNSGDQPNQHVGEVFAFGDLDADSQTDLLIGLPDYRGLGREGDVKVFFGPNLSSNEDDVYGSTGDTDFGAAVAFVEVDGETMLAAAAPGYNTDNGQIRFYPENEIGSGSPQPDHTITGGNFARVGTAFASAPADGDATRWLVGTFLGGVDIEGAAAVYSIETNVPATPTWTGTGR